MQEILIHKLHEYIQENNPDLLLQLEEAGTVTDYLSDKINREDVLVKQLDKEQPAYIIEEACMNLLTQDLHPSKFLYVWTILGVEFEERYQQLCDSGALKFEVINLVSLCNPVFEDLNFKKENEDSPFTRYAITGCIDEYFKTSTSE